MKRLDFDRLRKSLLLTLTFVLLTCGAFAQLVSGEYFFDDDPGVGNGTSIVITPDVIANTTINAVTSGLSSGYHHLSIRFLDLEGEYGITTTTPFFVNVSGYTNPNEEITLPVVAAEYFWDTDPGQGNGTTFYYPANAPSTAFSPTAPLDAGEHLLGVRVQEQGGKWGVTQWETVVVGIATNPPIASFSYAPDPAVAGIPTPLTNTSTNTNGSTLYWWDIDADGSIESTTTDFNFTFPSDGIYAVALSALNPPSGVANDAIVRYLFTNESISDDQGLASDFTPVPTAFDYGRQSDPSGAFVAGNERLASQTPVTNLTEFCISYWVKGSNVYVPVQFGDLDGSFYRGPSSGFHNIGGTNIQTGSTATIQNGNWHHLVLSSNSENTGFTSYLDGAIVQSISSSPFTSMNLDSIVLGGLNDANLMNGVLDDVMLFDRALSELEVQELYAASDMSTIVQQANVGILDLTITANGPTLFCEGESVELTAPAADAYLWSTGETTQSIVSTETESYSCVITLGSNTIVCNPVNVNVNPLPVFTVQVNNATNGLSNGSAIVELSEGVYANHTFNWSNGLTDAGVTNLIAGSYNVLVSNENCSILAPVEVADITVDPLNGIVRGEYFFGPDPGTGNGTALSVPQGQTILSLNDVSTSDMLPGFYLLSVRMQDSDGEWGVTATIPVSLLDPNPEVITPSFEDIVRGEYFFDDTDPGVGNGIALSAFVSGTSLTLMENISVAGLPPGQHSVFIRFQYTTGEWGVVQKGLFAVEFIFPDNLPAVQIPIIEAEYFFDANDPGVGNAIALSISNNVNINQSVSIDTDGLTPGLHKVSMRVKDISGHWSVTQVDEIEVLDLPCTTPDVSFAQATANAGEAMSLTNTSSNVDGSTVYSWDINADGSIEYATTNATQTFPNAGSYSVALTADNGGGCSSTIVQLVEVGPLLSTDLLADGPLVFCEGGSVTLTAPAGSSYLWSNYETSSSIVFSESGFYQCLFTDANGNNALSNMVEIIVHPGIAIESFVNNEVNSGANGSIGVIASGGSSFFYSYTWNTGDVTPILADLSAGAYEVTLDDGVCPVTLTLDVLNETVAPVEGIIEGEYFFDIDPGVGNATSMSVPTGMSITSYQDINTTSLAPGYHLLNIRMKDHLGKWGIASTQQVYLNDPDDTPIDNTPLNIIAAEYFFDDADPGVGNAMAFSGFTPAVNFTATEAGIDLTGLSPGLHKVSARTKTADGRWGITSASMFFIDIEINNNLPTEVLPVIEAEYFIGEDPGVGNGNQFSINPGTAINGVAGVDVTGLAPGTYNISVRTMDLAGHWSHTKTGVFTVQAVACAVPNVAFEPLTATPMVPTLFTNTSTNVLGGATFAWDFNGDGITDSFDENPSYVFPSAGTYFVSLFIDNGTGCSNAAVQEVVVGTPVLTDITVVGSTTLCYGESVLLQGPAGTNFLWNNGEVSSDITASASGSYQAVFTDGNGNEQVTNVVDVFVYPELIIQTEVNNATNGNSNGSAGVIVSGGASNIYTYAWSNGASTPIIVGLSPGVYDVTVSDGTCSQNVSFSVGNENTVAGITAAEYFWNDDPGIGNGTSIPIQQGESIISFAEVETTGLAQGYHLISIRTKDTSNKWGITSTYPVFLEEPSLPITYEAFDVITGEYFYDDVDLGQGNATPITIDPTGDYIAESYNFDISMLSPGEHKVSVRVLDEDGIWSVTQTSFFNLCNPPAAPAVVATVVDICAESTATLEAIDEGFNLLWSAPDGSTFFSGPTWNINGIAISQAGVYTVVAESEAGCYSVPTEVTVNVLQAPVITSLISGPAVACPEDIGIAYFLEPVEFATNYTWNLPAGATILSGNNTNNVGIDFSGITVTSGSISVTVSNICGSVTSSEFNITFECIGTDTDGDGVLDEFDNCPDVFNPDQSLTIFYPDTDSDGFGDINFPTPLCELEAGYTTDNTDCDDTNDLVYPGAPGTSEGIDNNCDGTIGPGEYDCPTDLNGDGLINATDLLIFLGSFGCTSGCGNSDINGDGPVNASDLLIFLGTFGSSCAP
ncbi:MAG: PKD repeat protein [Flavobacteriales bacterium]|jgi:PKD repeat protein